MNEKWIDAVILALVVACILILTIAVARAQVVLDSTSVLEWSYNDDPAVTASEALGFRHSIYVDGVYTLDLLRVSCGDGPPVTCSVPAPADWRTSIARGQHTLTYVATLGTTSSDPSNGVAVIRPLPQGTLAVRPGS